MENPAFPRGILRARTLTCVVRPVMIQRALEKILASASGLPDPLPADPLSHLSAWLDDAVRAAKQPNPNSMALATATATGTPSVRIVLCKQVEPATASLIFFTNYTSRKAAELEANPRAAGVFHWDHQDRQARVEGRIERVSPAESDAYFRTRHVLSRLGAWASEQSKPMARRTDLIARVLETAERFAISPADLIGPPDAAPIPRPPQWGGYRLRIDAVELWQGHPGRLHDRARWERAAEGWTATRLFP